MPDLEKLNKGFDQMIDLMGEMKKSLSDEPPKQAAPKQEQPKQAPEAAPAPAAPEAAAIEEYDYSSFEQLKKAILSDKWPEAVNPNLICDPSSETDKVERGRGIIELMIEEDLTGLKFLDIGCGEGQCANLTTDYGTELSVGYDISEFPSWTGFEKPTMTTDFEKVKENAPYDVIILFDVIDHIQQEDPVSLLNKAREVLKDDGKIYMRVHPFTSRHATHLYHDLNKAYAHLVYTEEEIEKLAPGSQHAEANSGVLYPLRTYNEYVDKAKLKCVNRRDITEKVEPFFKIPKIAERIIGNTKMSSFPEFQMSMQFIDYVLGK